MEDEPEFEEYQVSFEGPCTCDHEPDQHGWGECGQPGCTCQAGWCE